MASAAQVKINPATGEIAVQSGGRWMIVPKGQYKYNPQTNEYAVQDSGRWAIYPGPSGSDDPLRTDRSKWGATEKISNVVNQVGTGIYKGLAGLIALPNTLSALSADRSQAPRHPVAGRAIPGADQYVKSNVQSTGTNPGTDYLPSYAGVLGVMQNRLGIPLAPATTTADKLLQAGGQGAAAVVLPGSAAANLTGGVVGSEASELAGMATEGTKAEPYARLVAGLIGGATGVGGANKAVASSVEDLLSRATMGTTQGEWNAAMQLQAQAAKAGAPITASEALAQVQGGNRQLMGLQRFVEQAPDSERSMSQFMANRPGGNQAATGGQLDALAQRPDAPFEVGPTIQAAAQKSIGDVRQQINALTEKWYQWGGNMQIPPAEFAAIDESPVFQSYLSKVRSDPLFQQELKDLPDNSVAVVNQVKKLMDEDAANYSTYGTGQTSPERAMKLDQAQGPMVQAAKEASPLYEGALEQQAQLRRSTLEPMKRGATGQLADTSDWTQQAKVLMSDTPGAEREVAKTVRDIIKADPENGAVKVGTLLRMKLEDMWNKAQPSMKGTADEFRGANFASILEKNPQQMKSLEAAIKALPNGETQWAGFRNLLKVFEAQGQRLPAGSPTEFNRMMTEGFQRGLTGDLKSFGRDMLDRWNIRRRTGELARVLTDPEGVKLLQQLAILGPNSRRAQQLVQAFYQGEQATESGPIGLPAIGRLPAAAQ